MKIDDFALGAYKVESTFTMGRYIRQKCYIEMLEITKEQYEKDIEKGITVIIMNDKYYEINSTIAGMPKRLGKYVNLDNFESGFSIKADDPEFEDKKLTYKHVKGGVILVPTDFTIKE